MMPVPGGIRIPASHFPQNKATHRRAFVPPAGHFLRIMPRPSGRGVIVI